MNQTEKWRPWPLLQDPTSVAAFLLVLGVPLLLPFGRTSEAPVLIGALLGLHALVRGPRDWLRAAPVQAFLAASGAYVLAALLSAPDAVAPEKTWTTALASVRLPLFGIGLAALCVRALANGVAAPLLGRALTVAAALPIALWTVDGIVQIVSGHSLGGTLDADRLSGIFGADDLKLGPLLPTLAPLLLWPLLEQEARGGRAVLLGAYLATMWVVLLAGSRAGWVSFALVTLGLAWRLAGGSRRLLVAWLGGALLLGCVAGIAAYQLSPSFAERVSRTLRVNQGDADFALAGRVPIFRTAVAMAMAHPINGVGVRGFRHAYPDYASAGDPWVDPATHTGASHAHQLLLELLTETGVVGLALWLLGGFAFARIGLRRVLTASERAPWIALGVLVFPINTHLAFYSSFLGLVLGWLLTCCMLQALLIERGDARA